MIFFWSLSDNKSSRFSRTLFSILANLNNDVHSLYKSFGDYQEHVQRVVFLPILFSGYVVLLVLVSLV